MTVNSSDAGQKSAQRSFALAGEAWAASLGAPQSKLPSSPPQADLEIGLGYTLQVLATASLE